MRKRELKNMEWGILVVAIILCVIGIVALFSATQETEYDEFTKQIIWFVISIIAMVILMFIDYNLLLKASYSSEYSSSTIFKPYTKSFFIKLSITEQIILQPGLLLSIFIYSLNTLENSKS